MRRAITTLALIFVVIVAGMTALVLQVNPNDFRSYMTQQVAERSGYKLRLEGDLRWHVWPQLSILTDRISIIAPGAQQPLVSAENMRLDVALLPLLSHQLRIKQVMLKNAIIRITPQSEEKTSQGSPVSPSGSHIPSGEWKLDIAHLKIVDSLLIWQNERNEQFNFRDLNLDLIQDTERQAQLTLSTRLNRDQRELKLALEGRADLREYPWRIGGKVSELTWHLKGADLPAEGMSGHASFLADWQRDQQYFQFNDVSLSVNDSLLQGSVSGKLTERPEFDVNLRAEKLNIDTLAGVSEQVSKPQQSGKVSVKPARSPVIATPTGSDTRPGILSYIKTVLRIQANTARWQNIDLEKLDFQLRQDGNTLTINTLTGQAGEGTFSLPGQMKLDTQPARIELMPQLKNMDAAILLPIFQLPAAVSGKLSLSGKFNGSQLNVQDFAANWQGKATFSLHQTEFTDLDIRQMIQQAVTHSSDQVSTDPSVSNNPAIEALRGDLLLNKGQLTLSDIKGEAPFMTLAGKGEFNLPEQQSDIRLNVNITGGWAGDSGLVEILQKTSVPLRFYGQWDNLQYSLPVAELFNKQLQDKARSRLKAWQEQQ